MRRVLVVVVVFAAGLSIGLMAAGRIPKSSIETTSARASSTRTNTDANEGPHEYSLPNTTVHILRAEELGRSYPLWVDVPASYATSDKTFPVVFVTDAAYSFPLVRSIRNLLGQRGRNIEDFVLVGLAPAQGDTAAVSRSRDYTPTDPLTTPRSDDGNYNSEMKYGQAAAYRDFLESTVLPFIATNYRVDMRRKVFAGHSFGALFGAYVLCTKPAMFQQYILSSPSLWFDAKSILRIEQDYAGKIGNLDARVFMYAGSFETIRNGDRYFKSVDIVKDMEAFAKLLSSHRYPGLRVETHVVSDEDHLTVFPATISRGLLKVLPGSGPYTSG